MPAHTRTKTCNRVSAPINNAAAADSTVALSVTLESAQFFVNDLCRQYVTECARLLGARRLLPSSIGTCPNEHSTHQERAAVQLLRNSNFDPLSAMLLLRAQSLSSCTRKRASCARCAPLITFCAPFHFHPHATPCNPRGTARLQLATAHAQLGRCAGEQRATRAI